MKNTIDRNSGLFEPGVADLINIKSARIDNLIGSIVTPDIAKKENLSRIAETFTPVSRDIHIPRPDGYTINAHLEIKKCQNTSIKIGKVYFINLVFSDLTAWSEVIGHPDTRVPTYYSDEWIKVASLNVMPDQDIYIRTAPILTSGSDEYGGFILSKLKGGTYDIYIKGLIENGSTIPINTFFLRNE